MITRAAEPGEVITAGTAILTLLDLNRVYLRGFIPKGEIGRVKIGAGTGPPLPRFTTLISRLKPTFSASIRKLRLRQRTPYFRDDRVKQVVGIKLQLKIAIGFAKTGDAGRWRNCGPRRTRGQNTGER